MKIIKPIAIAAALAALPSIANAAEYFLYVGSYTIEPSSGRPPRAPQPAAPGAPARAAAEPSTSKGIYAWRYDDASNKLTPLGLVAESANPAHLWSSPNGKTVYAVEWQEYNARVQPSVDAYAVDPKTGALKLINKQNTGGELPNEVVLDPSGKVAGVVNYKTGSLALLPVNADGSLGAPFAVQQSTGELLNPKGDGPHAHGITFSKDGKWAYEAELGLDRVYSYALDIPGKKLTLIDTATTPPGSGPRRLVLGRDDKFLYMARQNDGKVSVYATDKGKLKEIQVIGSNKDPGARGGVAEVLIDHAGKFLYVSLRGSSTIAVYAIDQTTGMLTLQENVPTLGVSPRNMVISPSGDLMFVANQTSGDVTIFKINHANGHLDPVEGQIKVSQAAGVALVPAGR